MVFSNKIRNKFVFSILPLTILFLIILEYTSFKIFSNEAKRFITETGLKQNYISMQKIEEQLLKYQEMLDLVSRFPIFTEYFSYRTLDLNDEIFPISNDIKELFANIYSPDPFFEYIEFVADSGVMSFDEQIFKDLEVNINFGTKRRDDKSIKSMKENKQKYLVFNSQIVSKTNNSIGRLSIYYSNKILYKILEETQLSNSRTSFIIDEKNNLITAPRTGLNIKLSEIISEKVESELIREFEQNRSKYISICITFKDRGWRLITIIPEDKIFYDISKIKIFFFLISLLFLVIISATLLVIIYTILKPIERLHRSITSASGKYSDLNVQVSAKDEIGALTESFNKMCKEIKDYEIRVAQQSKLVAIGQTTAMLAHDVRKPFSLMQMLLTKFESFKSNPSFLNEAKTAIAKSIKQVECMISDIMDFSRDVKLNTRPSSIVSLINYSIKISAELYAADIALFYDFKHIHKPLVDDERIIRVFSNVLCNGIEAIKDIGKREMGELRVQTNEVENFVEISISNDGPHIPEDDIGKLFEPFFTKGKKKGTGLGLASSRKITNLHGGTIEVKNSSMGVDFIISLPVSNIYDTIDTSNLPRNINDIILSDVTDRTRVDRDIEQLAKGDKSFKVLLLEDEILYRAYIRNIIKKNERLDKKITLYETHNIDDALAIIESEKITHVIVDIDLNDTRNGFDFLKILKDRYPVVKSLVHSNRCIEEDMLKVRELMAEGIIAKPLNIEHLVKFLMGERKFHKSMNMENNLEVIIN